MNIGERVGDYEVVQVLGAGGMGEVYKVRNVISDRMEAMKVLLPSMSGDPGLASRFLREIKTQAALDHPHIARLHTALQSGDQLFMVMEFVAGSSVEKLMEQGTLAFSDSIDYAAQVLEALAYAHARGVVHRDIKPANIMVTPAGTAKLMDFGIARIKEDRHLTKTGHTVGSLYYMSPEQIRGSEPDPRSDLYSLGITFYEMVTGRKPFQGDSDYSIMAAHLQQTPTAPIEVVPGVPSAVSEIILMAIAKDPAERFQSADAFRAALKNAGSGTAPAASGVATRAVVPDTRFANTPPPMPAGGSGMAPTRPAYQQMPADYTAPPPPPPPAAYGAPAYSAPAYSAPSAASSNPAEPPKSNSRRGLYMALGSVATLAVLAAGIIEIPKMRGTSAQTNPITKSQEQTPVGDGPGPIPSPSPAPEPIQGGIPLPVAQLPSPQPRPAQVNPRPTPAPTPTPAPAPNPKQVRVEETPRPTPTPVPQPTPTPQPTPQPTPAPAPAPAPTPAANPALAQLRQEYNQLSIRASTAKDGLQSLQQQMQRQGLNLRADIREAQTRMDYQLKEAMDSIRRGDAEQAGKDLQMARLAIEQIEKFQGR